MVKILFLLVLNILASCISFSQSKLVDLNWKLVNDGNSSVLVFEESFVKSPSQLPEYAHFVSLNNNELIEANIVIINERLLSSSELRAYNISYKDIKKDNVALNVSYTFKQKKDKKGVISIVPLYKKNNQVYLIESFNINYSIKQNYSISNNRSGSAFKSTSVLASGDVYKLGIVKDGVYKITYSYLESNGMLSSSIQSNLLNVYGNHNGMLPEENSGFRYDDLEKNAIYIEDGNDGVFEDGDYILFYAQSADKWKLNSGTGLFYFEKNRVNIGDNKR